MATHKVPQDVEADDKFLGPLSFRQFLFFGATLICGYLTFLMSTTVWPLAFVFGVPMLAFGALTIPWSKEQPTELFLAARIRFLIKPRVRIWDQSGVKDLVTITVPVRLAHVYSDGLSQSEVRSRFNALANIVDSRGWAVKNILPADSPSDRLVEVAVTDDEAKIFADSTPDVFDDSAGIISRQFETMIEQSEQTRKAETLKLVEQARNRGSDEPADRSMPAVANQATFAEATGAPGQSALQNSQDFWFMHESPQPTDPSLATFQNSTVIAPGTASRAINPTAQTALDDLILSEQELLEAVHEKQKRDSMQTPSWHEKVLNPNATLPAAEQQPEENISAQAQAPMTPAPNPDILDLARSNDLNIETLARQANKKHDLGNDEVIISLH
jgi:hypothetical protein